MLVGYRRAVRHAALGTMKRKHTTSAVARSPAKKSRPDLPDYHETPMLCDGHGEFIWPAPRDQLERAKQTILDCAAANAVTVICPDKDADGLSSGVILTRTLQLLGLSHDLIKIHLIDKGTTVNSDSERQKLASYNPRFIFVLDQGSRRSPPLVPDPETTTLVIDHHFALDTDFPARSAHVTACNSPPVATTSLLTYHLCADLHPLAREQCDWLAVVGTHGDLGTNLKWSPPFPDMSIPLKTYTKKLLNEIVSLVNAPRRTAAYDVLAAWTALSTASHPRDVLSHPRLRQAKHEVAAEVERCTHTPPRFSADGRVAVFRIASAAQVHPVIATRWAGHLNSKALEMVMVANEGYLPGKVNFSCRVARCAKGRGQEVDIIAALKGYAGLSSHEKVPLLDRVGDDFARGHVQASGGIVAVEDFEELVGLMRVGEKSAKSKSAETSPTKAGKKAIDSGQTNTLMGYFGKKKEEQAGVA